MRRGRQKRKLKPYLLIVCEGTVVEEYYFKSIIEELDNDEYAFDVVLVESEKTTAVELVKVTQSYITKDDKEAQFWAVFDKNGYTKHEQAFKLAEKRGKKVNIAFSSIAFEHWVLLHYEQNKTPFSKSGNVIDYLDKSGHYPGYMKREEKAELIYPELRDKTETAIENAAWLRYEMKTDLDLQDGKIYQINPYTDIDRLISILLNYNKQIIWGNIGETIPVDGLNIRIANCTESENNLVMEVLIENNQSVAYVENNESRNFYLTDDNSRKNFECKIEPPVLIFPDETKSFKLVFSDMAMLNNIKLNFEFKNNLLIVPLCNRILKH
ncbi:MAG: RloB domain-containing protein [Desulfobacterales bacterium]|nr:RloB domain-containing protein [Desulfobacterales bacterium]